MQTDAHRPGKVDYISTLGQTEVTCKPCEDLCALPCTQILGWEKGDMEKKSWRTSSYHTEAKALTITVHLVLNTATDIIVRGERMSKCMKGSLVVRGLRDHVTCLTPLKLPQQNTWDWVICKRWKCIAHGSGSWKVQDGGISTVSVQWGFTLCFKDGSFCCITTWWKKSGSSLQPLL